MKRAALLWVLLFALALTVAVDAARSHGSRLAWAKPDTPCNADNIGRLEWVQDPTLNGWVLWECTRDGWRRIRVDTAPGWRALAEFNGWRYRPHNGALVLMWHSCHGNKWHWRDYAGYVKR